jgi:hypothetical protein
VSVRQHTDKGAGSSKLYRTCSCTQAIDNGGEISKPSAFLQPLRDRLEPDSRGFSLLSLSVFHIVLVVGLFLFPQPYIHRSLRKHQQPNARMNRPIARVDWLSCCAMTQFTAFLFHSNRNHAVSMVSTAAQVECSAVILKSRQRGSEIGAKSTFYPSFSLNADWHGHCEHTVCAPGYSVT